MTALVAVAGLALASCTSGASTDSGDTPSASPVSSSPSASPSTPSLPPSSTVSVPAGVSLTEPGSALSFGDSATVVFEANQKRGTALELTVKRAAEGLLTDFSGFILDDPYKKKASYYYVKVSVTNVGEGDVGGAPVPLWGVNGDNTLLPAVAFTTSFAKCDSKPLPAKFGPGDTFDTCLVYLSPDRGSLESVSYRPTEAFNPIQWTGDIAKPPVVKTKKQGSKKNR